MNVGEALELRVLVAAINKLSVEAVAEGSCPSCEALFEDSGIGGPDWELIEQNHAADCRIHAHMADLEAALPEGWAYRLEWRELRTGRGLTHTKVVQVVSPQR